MTDLNVTIDRTAEISRRVATTLEPELAKRALPKLLLAKAASPTKRRAAVA